MRVEEIEEQILCPTQDSLAQQVQQGAIFTSSPMLSFIGRVLDYVVKASRLRAG